MLFLYLNQKEFKKELSNFKFEAYDYGPHSDDIRDLLYTLRDNKIINIKIKETNDFLNSDDIDYDDISIRPIYYNKEEIYSLTNIGKQIGEKIKNKYLDFESLDKFKKKFNNLKLRRLIHLIYTKYPNMTTKSKIINEIFG